MFASHRVVAGHSPIRRSGLFVALAAILGFVLSACGSASTTTTTTVPTSTTSNSGNASTTTVPASAAAAATVVKAAKAAMLAQSSVRYAVTVDNTQSKTSYSIVADLGTTSGMQTLQSGSAIGRVIVTTSGAYLSGNSSGLSDFFGMPSKDITKVGTHWVDVPSGSSQYSSLADSNTLGPIATTLFPTTQSVTLTTGTYQGQKADILAWKQTSNGTTSLLHLYVAANGTTLPLYAVGTSSDVTQKITFTHWNETISVTAPSPTIPFSSVSSS